ncbi:TetR/AcrR family transcriptional regulator [Pseudonocardia sp. HH130630-07]|uniref:TetR/AcrR family transcriptional regulator n=1 Tax=Pseudonocardia sp. HH130630-07 TaxID=1690815 RepID=UPI00081502C2|nr:TetR/AcrR family transcriptional regulator [Pseudonocardia sp. HH130630-07]ANY08487.1 TetR family transcriptional regulator [Pseudonocardia sp. HH130630-07]
MTDTAAAARRGRRPTSERRRALQRLEISRVAIRLFRTHGLAGTSGEQIADAVGLSARTLWRWFRTKESCVEPVLSLSTDTFTACLRRWPAGKSLDEHLLSDFGGHVDAGPDDGELVLAVLRLARHEPALRAIWLVVQERAEPVLAQILADRLGRAASDVEIRVQAAALNAALRITTEDVAAVTADGHRPPVDDLVRALSAAVRAATHGIEGDRPV